MEGDTRAQLSQSTETRRGREREMGRNGRHRDRKRGRDWRGSAKKILRDGGEEKIERDGEIDT